MNKLNNSYLFKFIFSQMEKLDAGKIDVDEAKAQATLAKQANNSLRYELDRSATLIKISEHNKAHQEDIKLREIEQS